MSKNTNTVYGLNNPLQESDPYTIKSSRAPTANDKGYAIGTIWIDEASNKSYILTSITASVPFWSLASAGSGDLETLTGNTGGAISPTAGGTINILGSNGVLVTGTSNTLTITSDQGGYPITPFVVGPAGDAGYQTVQAAINAANTAGGGAVYVQPGTYNENLTLYSNVSIHGTNVQTSIINGVHTPPLTGSILFQNISLYSGTHILNSSAAGATTILIDGCSGYADSGYIMNLLNWTGDLSINNSYFTGSSNGIINNTGGADISLTDSILGFGSSNIMVASGDLDMTLCYIGCPVSTVTGCVLDIDYVEFGNYLIFNNNTIGSLFFSSIASSINPSITQNSSGIIALVGNSLNSSNTNAIAGSGSGQIWMTGNQFLASTGISGSLSVNSNYKTQVAALSYAPAATGTSAGPFYFGTVTLVNGTATITSSVVTGTSKIRLTRYVVGATGANALGVLAIGTITPNTSFVINSYQASNATAIQTTDQSQVIWEIIA